MRGIHGSCPRNRGTETRVKMVQPDGFGLRRGSGASAPVCWCPRQKLGGCVSGRPTSIPAIPRDLSSMPEVSVRKKAAGQKASEIADQPERLDHSFKERAGMVRLAISTR